MKNRASILAVALLLFVSTQAQDKYFTRDGKVRFFSSTPMEDIEAINEKATAVWVPSSMRIEFAVLMKAFQFEKALMQEHFNENYVESDTYPKAQMKATIAGITEDDLATPGEYPVEVTGEMELHGAKRPITEKGTITVGKDGSIVAESKFMINPENYNIKIPSVVRDNIAEQFEVSVKFDLKKM